jgi:hypothetical protein
MHKELKMMIKKVQLMIAAIALFAAMPAVAGAQSLVFSQVLLVNSQTTVPAGKVWKIEGVMMPPDGTIKYTASSGSGSCASPCNGSTTKWTSFSTAYLPTTSLYGLAINGTNYLNITFPVWVPAGTTVAAKGPTENCFSNAGCYNNVCPPAAFSVTGVMSVIEFTVTP